jgi:hypothetical protein
MGMVPHRPLWSTYVVFRVEIGAKFEKRVRDVTSIGFTRVMKRRFSSFLEILCSHTTKDVRRMSTSHTFHDTERERTLLATLKSWPIFTRNSTTSKEP